MNKYGKRIFWTICIVVLCYVDQQLGSRMGEWQLVYKNVTIVVVGLMALVHYPLRSFLKPIYYIWALISVIGGYAIVTIGEKYTYYPSRLRWVVIFGAVYGLLSLRTAYALFKEKKAPAVNKWVLLFLGIFWALTMLSKYDVQLSMLYVGGFWIFSLTAFSREEKRDLGNAVLDGIMIGFWLIQGAAFMHRPYDIVRYLGMYSNTNINALLYLMAYCAFLGRFYLLETGLDLANPKKGIRKTLQTIGKWLCFGQAAFMWGYVFLTMCRSAMLGMAVATLILWIWRLRFRKGRRILALAGNTAVFAMIVILGLPVVYGAVRYIPPVFNDPLYFFEGESPERVDSSDPWDSPKYVKWEDVVKENLGRFANLLPKFEKKETAEPNVAWNAAKYVGDRPLLFLNHWDINMTASYKIWCTLTSTGAVWDAEEEQESEVLNNSTWIRARIYSHYLENMNLRGHKEEENGLWVGEEYFAPHAHNLFLQYAFNYGAIAGILFLLFVGTTIGVLWKEKTPHLFLYVAILVFGLTEIMWRDGTLAFALVYLIPALTSKLSSGCQKKTDVVE